ncbi:MAG: prenyltransferase/squalene oxidase repeat-containing protein [Actinomycetes bacterium]
MSTRHPGFARMVTVATATLLVAPAFLAAAAGPSYAADAPYGVGLFGSQDPTYDGVYRQGLSILALDASGAQVPTDSVTWLLGQQCSDGGFTSYHAPGDRCGDARDSNATSMAAMALYRVGHPTDAGRAIEWLLGHQLPNGGWEYSAGWGGDANSTALAVQALLAAGMLPDEMPASGGNTPYDFLSTLQLGCDATPQQRGAFDYQAEDPLAPNDYATVQAVQALAGSTLPVEPGPVAAGAGSPVCPAVVRTGTTSDELAGRGAAYLVGRLAASGDVIPNAFGPGADLGSTANAVLALVADGSGSPQLQTSYQALVDGSAGYTVAHGVVVPAAAAITLLAAHAVGGDLSALGDGHLVAQLQQSAAQAPTSGGAGGTGGGTPVPSPSASGTGGHGSTSPRASASAATLPATGSELSLSLSLSLAAVALLGSGLVLLRLGRRPTTTPTKGSS